MASWLYVLLHLLLAFIAILFAVPAWTQFARHFTFVIPFTGMLSQENVIDAEAERAILKTSLNTVLLILVISHVLVLVISHFLGFSAVFTLAIALVVNVCKLFGKRWHAYFGLSKENEQKFLLQNKTRMDMKLYQTSRAKAQIDADPKK